MVINNTNNPTIEEQIIKLISWDFNIPPSKINTFTDFSDDLHLDAVDRLLLIANLEKELKVYLSSEEASTIETVYDAAQCFYKATA